MWQDKLKEIIYILENSNVNEIEINFWGRKFRVVKSPNTVLSNELQNQNAAPRSQKIAGARCLKGKIAYMSGQFSARSR